MDMNCTSSSSEAPQGAPGGALDDLLKLSAMLGLVAQAAWAVRWLWATFVRSVFFSLDRYDSIESNREALWVIGHVARSGNARVVARFGSSCMLSRKLVSECTLLPRGVFVWISQRPRGTNGQTVEVVEVMRPRWEPSLVPEPRLGEVDVLDLENNNKYADLVSETVRFDHAGVPEPARAFARDVRDLVLGRLDWCEDDTGSKAFRSAVYCLGGPPGSASRSRPRWSPRSSRTMASRSRSARGTARARRRPETPSGSSSGTTPDRETRSSWRSTSSTRCSRARSRERHAMA